ncbi:MAG: 50S ribosomal protein L23 [Coriobacteriales bacterium]|nr:50S ribosomal protein L23 [Coriobacteriales bacterium]
MLARDIIIAPVVSERAFDMQAYNRYTFKVDKRASKIQIARAIEEIFGVTVLKVNTSNVKPKPKRTRYQLGYTSTWKKAIVTLVEGDKIELFANQD